MPSNLRSTMAYLSYHSILPRHAGDRRIYEYSRSDYYWPNMATDAYNTVKFCTDFPRMRTKFGHRRKRELLPPFGSLELVAKIFSDCSHGLGPATKSWSLLQIGIISSHGQYVLLISLRSKCPMSFQQLGYPLRYPRYNTI